MATENVGGGREWMCHVIQFNRYFFFFYTDTGPVVS